MSDFESDFDKPLKNPPPVPDYSEWLAIGQKLAAKHSGYQWSIGDWIVLGDDHFNIAGVIPGYLLLHESTKDDGTNGFKSAKVPNFWADVEAAIGLATSTLKQYAQVARAYPKKKRVKGLGWSHHLTVVSYERRYEYLKACLDVPEGEKPRSITWLCKYVAKEDGEETAERFAPNFVRIPMSDEAYKMLKDLAKYYGTDMAAIVSVPFKAALEVFLEEQKKKVCVDVFGIYENRGRNSTWPFDRMVTRRQKAALCWRTKHKKPMQPELSEAQKVRALASWEKRRARRHSGLSFQLTRRSELGRVA